MAYESYSAYLSISKLHTDPSQHYADSLQGIIDDRFSIASNYKEISLLDRDTLAATTIGIRLEAIASVNMEDSIRDDYFKVLFKNKDTDIVLGDLFEFSSYRWMVIDISKNESEVMTALIQRCNAKLKFIESNNDVLPTITNDIISIDCIAEKKSYDIEKDRYYSIPNEEVRIKIANNSDSRKIKMDTRKGTRFLLGNPVMAYNAKAIDSLSMVRTDINDSNEDNGIILLKLQTEGLNTKTDNTTQMVAKQYCYGSV